MKEKEYILIGGTDSFASHSTEVFDIVVYIEEIEHHPHFHCIDRKTKGEKFNVSIDINNNGLIQKPIRYFPHASNCVDMLTSKQEKVLNDFMHDGDNYDRTVDAWNEHHSVTNYLTDDFGNPVPVCYHTAVKNKDGRGNVIVPDFLDIGF